MKVKKIYSWQKVVGESYFISPQFSNTIASHLHKVDRLDVLVYKRYLYCNQPMISKIFVAILKDHNE